MDNSATKQDHMEATCSQPKGAMSDELQASATEEYQIYYLKEEGSDQSQDEEGIETQHTRAIPQLSEVTAVKMREKQEVFEENCMVNQPVLKGDVSQNDAPAIDSESDDQILNPNSYSFPMNSTRVLLSVKPQSSTHSSPRDGNIPIDPPSSHQTTPQTIDLPQRLSNDGQIHNDVQSDEEFHFKGMLYKCSQCSQIFSMYENFSLHMRTHEADPPFKCPHCNKMFASRNTHARHMRAHNGDKPYQCTFCDKRFSCISSLNYHLRTHTGEKKHKCLNCNKMFDNRSKLMRHFISHLGQKPHQCPCCNKGFSHYSSLQRHMKDHSGEKSSLCPQCGRKFRDDTNLASHLKTHTREKPFECLECHKTFSWKSNLSHHMKSHKKEIVT